MMINSNKTNEKGTLCSGGCNSRTESTTPLPHGAASGSRGSNDVVPWSSTPPPPLGETIGQRRQERDPVDFDPVRGGGSVAGDSHAPLETRSGRRYKGDHCRLDGDTTPECAGSIWECGTIRIARQGYKRRAMSEEAPRIGRKYGRVYLHQDEGAHPDSRQDWWAGGRWGSLERRAERAERAAGQQAATRRPHLRSR